MKTIDVNVLLLFQKKIISSTGGLDGVRDKRLLESALSRSNMTFDGSDLYDSIEKKISVITHSLIANHGFVDGNKRIGVAMMILLCKMNDIKIHYTQQELVKLGLAVASGKENSKNIYEWIIDHKM